MNKAVKYSIIGVCTIISVIVLGILYIVTFLPDIPVQDIKVEINAKRVERGKYLVHHVAVCIDCHSQRDWEKFSGPIKPGTEGMGGEKFDKRMGFPGNFYSANITPANLKNHSDGELFRAITSGVKKNGDVIFPVMPYMNYGKMDKEDIYSIIAYIRTLKPKQSTIPASSADFPMNIIMHTMPKEPTFTKMPDKSDKVNYGKYLVNTAACFDCHTPFDKGEYDMTKAFAGGRSFEMPWGTLTSPNISPDNKTGIGTWTEEVFLTKFKSYDPDSGYVAPKASMDKYNVIMPWIMYAGMTREDLSAMYTYLHQLKAIKNKVIKIKMK